jgi:hypothetical protein
MTDQMGTRGVKVTGNHQIDQATAELAVLVRDARAGSHVRYSEQDHYDEAMRLRDEFLAGSYTALVRELAGNYRRGLVSAETAMDAIASALGE